MRCLGCGGSIPWDGKGLFSYTCPCDATVFYDEKTGIHPPISLIAALCVKKDVPHIDYYLGKSNYTSPGKEEMYDLLRSINAIWSWECNECRQKYIERTVYEVANRLYRFRVHPALKEIIEDAINSEEEAKNVEQDS